LSSILSDALDRNPTFFTLFIGNNDVLAYALSGGTSDNITPLHGTPGLGFESSLLAIVNAITANGAKGVIANLGDITSVPFFNTIPYNGLQLNHQSAGWLNNKYATAGIHFRPGKNPFVISDPVANVSGLRPIEKKELILLDVLLDPSKEHYLNGSMAIPEKYVLTAPKIFKIQNAIKSYNVIIKSIAHSKGLALMDTNALLKTAKKDRFYIEANHSISYKKRGVFSLDGLHPNSFGQVLLANEFIKAINETFNSRIPVIKRIKV
ncbi:MAG: hypothetical protein JWO32_8, partial [Bacteroidetes bacterium]|nr:hypothetical protein [Bacteroidota bacterium]